MGLERTPTMFVDDMLRHGRSWLDVLAVGRVIRDGRWRDDVKRILIERGLMPQDEAEAKRLQIKDIELKRQTPEEPKYACTRKGGRKKK